MNFLEFKLSINPYDFKSYHYSNKKDVYLKNSLDITMGIVVFIPGFRWAISGTYFILDISGAFGDWGQPSGVRSDGVPYNTNEMGNGAGRLGTYGHYKFPSPYELKFEMEYEPPIEHIHQDFLREQQEMEVDDVQGLLYERYEVEIDNTLVIPKRIFKIKN